MTIKTSSLGGGGGLPRLAPDLTWPADTSGSSPQIILTGIDPSAGLTTVLSITGTKGYISLLYLSGCISENFTIKLTVDGTIIWNDVKNVTSAIAVLIGGINPSNFFYDSVSFNDSFLLEVQSTTDTDIGCQYVLRKTL